MCSLRAEPGLGPLGDPVLRLPARPRPAVSQPRVTCPGPSQQIARAGSLGTTEMSSLAVPEAAGLRPMYAGLHPVCRLQGRILPGLFQLLVAPGVPRRVAAPLRSLPPLSRAFCSASVCLSLLLFLKGPQPYWILHDLILTNEVCKDPVSKWGCTLRVQVDGKFRGMLFSPG